MKALDRLRNWFLAPVLERLDVLADQLDCVTDEVGEDDLRTDVDANE
jgi:hypothetical protein